MTKVIVNGREYREFETRADAEACASRVLKAHPTAIVGLLGSEDET